MKIRTTIINSKQSALVVISILISILIAFMLITVDWFQKNNEYQIVLEGYIDKAAFERCLKQAKPSKSINVYTWLIKEKCEKKWGIWKRVKKESVSFQSLLFKDFDKILIAVSIMAIGIYIVIFSYVLYEKCSNLGWKRLTVIAAFIPGIILALYMLDAAGSRVSGEEYFQILLGAIIGYASGIFTILGGLRLIAWVKDGFDPSP